MPLPAPVQRVLDRSFSVDVRSLALLRALLGGGLLIELCHRTADLRAFYSDIGVLPRAWLLTINGPWRISVHLANGEGWFAAAMLAAEMLAALALFIGWRTRLAGLGCFVLHASLLNRNPLIVLGGDTLLTGLLFWGLFLPLGARWSVDSAFTEHPPQDTHHRSWASAGLLLQTLSVFFFGALLLHRQQWSANGVDGGQAVHLDGYATALGARLRDAPVLAAALARCAFLIGLLAPLLALSPVLNAWLRFVAILALLLMQVAAILLWNLGPLPWFGIAGLTALAGNWVWDAFARGRRQPQSAVLRIFHDRDCEACARCARLLRTFLILPEMEIAAAQDNARANTLMLTNHSWVVIDRDDHAYLKWPALVVLLKRSPLLWPLGYLLSGVWAVRPGNAVYDFAVRHRSAFTAAVLPPLTSHHRRFATGRMAQCFAGLILLMSLSWNLGTAGALPGAISRALTPPLRLLRLDQSWDLSALFPAPQDGWYVLPAELTNGREFDLLHPRRDTVSYAKPADLAAEFPNMRWETYLERLASPRFQSSRPYYADWLCRSWNASHLPAETLKTFRIVYLLEAAAPAGYTPQPEQRLIWRHDCFASAQANAAQN